MEPIGEARNSSCIVSVRRLSPGFSFIEPLSDVLLDVYLSPKESEEKVYIEAFDSKDWVYYSEEAEFDETGRKRRKLSRRIRIKGSLGPHKIKVSFPNNKESLEIPLNVDVYTCIKTKSGFIDRFYDILALAIKKDNQMFKVDEGWIRCNPSWIRDHIHEMKGYKYWETDIKSFVEHMLNLQMENGAYYDFISSIEDPHKDFVSGEWKREDKENGVLYVRIPVEADLEYLLVEGAYTIWQATGDRGWIEKYLPKLEKGLFYSMSDPLRWDEKYQLVKRPFTIDTWDFTNYLFEDRLKTNIKIRELSLENPFCIMHGDNSGMFEACSLLSKIYEELGNREKSEFWKDKANNFRIFTNKFCWNGKFYTHQIHLDPNEASQYDETDRLSLSNAYTINRGLPEHYQIVKIIEEYRRRWERDKNRGKSFAEWYSIDPPYDRFSFYKDGEYINGGILPAVGGELAKASFKNGFEDYGVDILKRFAEKVESDGFVGFLYSKEGKDMGGGPPGWNAAAFISAIIEGLAGIEDESSLYRIVSLSPRWVALREDEVYVAARYGASDGYFAYKLSNIKPDRRIELEYSGSSEKVYCHILLPEEAKNTNIKVLSDGKQIDYDFSLIRDSKYIDFYLEKKASILEILY